MKRVRQPYWVNVYTGNDYGVGGITRFRSRERAIAVAKYVRNNSTDQPRCIYRIKVSPKAIQP